MENPVPINVGMTWEQFRTTLLTGNNICSEWHGKIFGNKHNPQSLYNMADGDDRITAFRHLPIHVQQQIVLHMVKENIGRIIYLNLREYYEAFNSGTEYNIIDKTKNLTIAIISGNDSQFTENVLFNMLFPTFHSKDADIIDWEQILIDSNWIEELPFEAFTFNEE